MACSRLQCFSVVHQRLYRIGCLRSGKLLLLGLLSLDNRNRQNLLQKVRIDVQHLGRSCLCLLCRRMCGVTLLPQKLSRSQERSCLLLPAHNGTPLVIHLGKIPVGVNVILIEIAEQRLGCRTHAHSLLQGLQAAVCHPRNLGSKALHMILLLLEQGLGNEHGKIYILYACLLEPCIQLLLDQLPDRITCGLDNHAALDGRIVAKLCLSHNICVPLREIYIH